MLLSIRACQNPKLTGITRIALQVVKAIQQLPLEVWMSRQDLEGLPLRSLKVRYGHKQQLSSGRAWLPCGDDGDGHFLKILGRIYLAEMHYCKTSL